MNSLDIRQRPIDEIRPYPGNPRKIPPSAVDKVAASIATYNWRQPIVVDSDGVIIVGHVRWLAAKQLRLERVPVHVAEGLTPEQARAYRLADNRTHEETSFDPELLRFELTELRASDFDLALTGFGRLEIDGALFPADAPQAEATPDLEEEVVSQLGDLWVCGPNKILCGDATDKDAVERLLGSEVPRLMTADPPYSVGYDPLWRERAGLGRQRQTGTVTNDDRVDWSEAYGLFPGDVAYVWHAGIHAAEVARSIEASGFDIRYQIVWAKPHFALGRGDYSWQHEPCWMAVRTGKSSNWSGDRTQSTLWEVPNMNPFGGNREETPAGHGTQKPVELMRRPILNHTSRGEIVYDPFLGAGTCLIAAHLTDRVCYGLEIEPRYVDMLIRRWQQMSHRPAVLDGASLTFDEVQQHRKIQKG